MNLSKNILSTFKCILEELDEELIRMDSDDRYCQKNLLGKIINSPRKRLGRKEPRIEQLFHTSKSLNETIKLSKELHSKLNFNCLPYEIKPIIENTLYEYVNESFDDSMENLLDKNIFEKVWKKNLKEFKSTFSSLTFQFPIKAFGLSNELNLTENIRLIPIKLQGLPEDEQECFRKTRAFECDFYIEIAITNKCSQKLALELAEKARDATLNSLKLLATHYSPRAIPVLGANDRNYHFFEYYKFGVSGEALNNSITKSFPSYQFDSEEFWKLFLDAKHKEDSLIEIALKVPELLLIPSVKTRVLDLMTRSLTWYGDAACEYSLVLKIQKAVTSLEAIVNFHEENTTETFIKRVNNLNSTQVNADDSIDDKARRLYKSRSQIVHGSSLNEHLDFCIVGFCSATLLRAMYYLNKFGFDKINFKKKLPDFLDSIPNIENGKFL